MYARQRLLFLRSLVTPRVCGSICMGQGGCEGVGVGVGVRKRTKKVELAAVKEIAVTDGGVGGRRWHGDMVVMVVILLTLLLW